MPVPVGLTSHLNLNASQHEIIWETAEELPHSLQEQLDKHQLKYRIYLSKMANLSDPVMKKTVKTTAYQMPSDMLEPGRVYYLGVSMVDKGKHQNQGPEMNSK